MIPILKGLNNKAPTKSCVNLHGLLLMLIGIALNNISTVITRKIQQQNSNYGAYEIMFTKGTFQAVASFVIMGALKVQITTVKRQEWKLIFYRALFSLLGTYFAWLSFPHLSLGLFSTIFNMNPLFTMVLAYIFLREKLKPIEVYTVIASFCGAMIIVLFSNKNNTWNPNASSSQLVFIGAVCSCSLYAVLISVAFVLIRSVKHIHYSIVNGVYSNILTIVSLLLLSVQWLTKDSGFAYNFTSE